MSKSNPPKNAITHGFYAADTVLPDENQQEFDELERAFFDEHCPEGISEKLTVSELASLHWKKRRFEAGLKQALQKQRDFDAKIDNWDVGALAKSQSKATQTYRYALGTRLRASACGDLAARAVLRGGGTAATRRP